MTFEASQLYSAFSEAWDSIRVADFRCRCFGWVNWSLSACYVPQELAGDQEVGNGVGVGGARGLGFPVVPWGCWVQNIQFSDFQMEVVLLLRAFGSVWRYVGLSLLGGGGCCCWMLLSVFQCIGQTPQQGIVPLKMSVVPRLRIPG